MNKEQIESIEQGYFDALEWLTWGCPDREQNGIPEEFELDSDTINKLVSNIVKDFITRTPPEKIEQYLTDIKSTQYHSRNHCLNLLGHDLYLTSERHGAGFWDRGLDDLGDELTALAEKCSTIHIFYDDETKTVTGE